MIMRLLRILAGNLLVAGLFVVVLAAGLRRPNLEMVVANFLIALTYSTSIGLVCWYVLPRAVPRLRGSTFSRRAQLLALLSVLGLMGGTVAFGLMSMAGFRLGYRESMLVCWVLTLTIGFISTLVEESRYRLEEASLAIQTRELERERAEKAATDARLKSLESRIHPHFLFNTLNSISSLVRSDPARAEEMIERLAELLRFSLDRHGSLVSLADELRVTRDYLEIERARFGERLRYSIEMEPGLESVRLPALSLQTLAENSVKYAVSPRREGAELRVSATRQGNRVRFVVADSGPGFVPESLPAGHGLDTLKERLASFFGSGAHLEARRLEPGMEVAFEVPN
jgi:sensor histidine kinase YesM